MNGKKNIYIYIVVVVVVVVVVVISYHSAVFCVL
jgi:hypothetical protein